MTNEATPTIQNTRDFNRKLEQIRSNPDLNDEAKRRMISEVYEEAARRHQELVAEQERATAEKIARLEGGVMGISYPYSASDADKELIRMSYRDAYDRAERIAGEALESNTYDNLEALLERAERSGDSRLAEAVYHVATEKGIRSVADSYLSSRPTERKRWEEYTSARLEAESVENLLFGAHAQGPMKSRRSWTATNPRATTRPPAPREGFGRLRKRERVPLQVRYVQSGPKKT
jgi:hypothetical protein